MMGMDARTGKALDDIAHLQQSIADILTTPLGSRIGRRDYGSLLPALIDQPFNAVTQLKLFGATATALMRWEQRIRITRVSLAPSGEPGAYLLDIAYQRTNQRRPGDQSRLTIPLRFRPS